jgi:enoyl-CoA hydratase
MALEWTIERSIGRLKLSQPPSNTMTMSFFRDLRLLIPKIIEGPQLKAIIISGNGRHFSSGADITELLNNVDHQTMVENYRAVLMLKQMDIPVIAAIRGVCIGSAFELALSGTFRICADDAVLGLPESTFNLMPGLGGIRRLSELAGMSIAIELVLRGSTFQAPEAFSMGLVDAVVSKSDVIPLAEAFAQSLPAKIQRSDRAVYIHKFLNPLYAAV